METETKCVNCGCSTPVDAPQTATVSDEAVQAPHTPIELTYTNYRGETSQRRITPRSVYFGSTEWHPEPQWLLTAYDHDKQEYRAFALNDFGNPVDVAAVQERCAIIAEGFRDKHWIAHDIKTGIFPNRSEAGIAIAAAIRDLSPAEPVDQWQDIAGVGERERLIIIGSYNAKGLWCAEVWHTKYLRDQQAKSASDFFMNAPHLEWVPTHFMELPAAPTSKGGE